MAVPAIAPTPETIAFAVATPATEAPKAVALKVRTTRRFPVAVVSGVAGWMPSRISIVPPPSAALVIIESVIALRTVSAM